VRPALDGRPTVLTQQQLQLIQGNEFLVLKVVAGEDLRNILNTEGSMEDLRKVVMASINDLRARVTAGTWEGTQRKERWEKVRSYACGVPVEYTLYHTLQKAPDREKYMVFLVKVERLVARPA